MSNLVFELEIPSFQPQQLQVLPKLVPGSHTHYAFPVGSSLNMVDVGAETTGRRPSELTLISLSAN